MSLVGDEEEEVDLCHVVSGGHLLIHVPSGEWGRRRRSLPYSVGDAQSYISPMADSGGQEDLCHVRCGGRSLIHVLSWRWGRRGI